MSTVVDEFVHLSEPDASWPEKFSGERVRIQQLLSLPVEHIGSTAVPGLISKPIIDMQLGAPAYPPSSDIAIALERLGYENLGESGVPRRLYFRRRGLDSFNLHVVEHDGEHWRNNIALRDYLRTSASARDAYGAAKHAAIERGANSLLSYSAAKAEVLARLFTKARAPGNAVVLCDAAGGDA